MGPGAIKHASDIEVELEQAGARYTPLGLELPEDLKLDRWADVGRKLCRADQLMKWWLGDWAAFGHRKFGQLKEFAEANGINYQTLRNAAHVSNAINLSRRRDKLEWSKHAEVAALKPAEQKKWLAKAESESLPVAELRKQIRMSQGKHNALEPDGPQLKFISKSLDDLTHFLTSQPEEFWDKARARLWHDRLTPIVEFREKLASIINGK